MLSRTLAVALALATAAEDVTYRSGSEEVRGYLALPEGKGPFPGLVVVHEWWGQNARVKERARAFAAKGYAALELAVSEPRLAAAVVYYGRLPTDEAVIAKIRAPILGNFGADDAGIPPEAVKAFEAAAARTGVKTDVKIYPGAGHAFASDPKRLAPEAARDADARTDAFLARTLARR
jgi:dienelactone hydrolase